MLTPEELGDVYGVLADRRSSKSALIKARVKISAHIAALESQLQVAVEALDRLALAVVILAPFDNTSESTFSQEVQKTIEEYFAQGECSLVDDAVVAYLRGENISQALQQIDQKEGGNE